MACKRKGMGRGRGKGYRNLISKDKKVHSDSAKGRKQPQELKQKPMSKYMLRRKKNQNIAEALEKFGRKHHLLTDSRIYFNNMAWSYDSDGKKTVIKNIKASDYFDYANDKGVSMSFEGGMYSALNHHYGFEIDNKLTEMLEKKFGVYYELGNAWNFSIYED